MLLTVGSEVSWCRSPCRSSMPRKSSHGTKRPNNVTAVQQYCLVSSLSTLSTRYPVTVGTAPWSFSLNSWIHLSPPSNCLSKGKYLALAVLLFFADSMPVDHTEVLIETQVSEMWPSVSICLVRCHVDTRRAHADCFRGLPELAQRAGSVLNAFPFPENDPVQCVQVHILPCLLAGEAVGIAKQVATYLNRGQLPAGKNLIGRPVQELPCLVILSGQLLRSGLCLVDLFFDMFLRCQTFQHGPHQGCPFPERSVQLGGVVGQVEHHGEAR